MTSHTIGVAHSKKCHLSSQLPLPLQSFVQLIILVLHVSVHSHCSIIICVFAVATDSCFSEKKNKTKKNNNKLFTTCQAPNRPASEHLAAKEPGIETGLST